MRTTVDRKSFAMLLRIVTIGATRALRPFLSMFGRGSSALRQLVVLPIVVDGRASCRSVRFDREIVIRPGVVDLRDLEHRSSWEPRAIAPFLEATGLVVDATPTWAMHPHEQGSR